MFQFEGFTLDVACSSLRAGNRAVALRPKSFEVLRYLVENADRVVTKEELIKAIWPNVVVTDESLAHCVSEVRQALGDTKQTIIATMPRSGYRLTAPVLRLAASAAAASSTSAAPSPLVGGGRGEALFVAHYVRVVARLWLNGRYWPHGKARTAEARDLDHLQDRRQQTWVGTVEAVTADEAVQ